MSRTLPPLRLLSVFDAVFRKGGIRNAATELNVSQPAVSQALRQLEDHIGAKLLDRHSRPARLTEGGRLLHRATTEGLGRIAEAIEEIRRVAAEPNPSVTVACSVGVATYWLMPRLAGFYERHPGAAINVMTTQQGAPPFLPRVDIAIRYGRGDWSDGAVHLLFDEEVNAVCSPAVAARLACDGGILDAATLIHVDVEDESWTRWPQYLRAIGRPAGRTRGELHFTNYVQATQAALNHQGIMLGWRSITGDLVKEGRLVAVLNAPYKPQEAFYLVVASEITSSNLCSHVAQWLCANAGG